jgi:hypothetical protein
LFGYSTRLTGNCMMSLSGPCSSCQSSHFVCLTRSTLNLNYLTSAITALRSTIQGIIIPFTNFTSNMQQRVIPPATQSCLPPPPWPSCSQVTAAHLLPPLQPSCRLPAGITTAVTTQTTLTPPGLTTGKVTGRGLIATSTDPATTQATFTPPGLVPGKATGPLEKAREKNQGSAAAQASTIWRPTMAKQRAHKAAAAAERAEFKAYQKDLGLLLNEDGEELAPSTPQEAATRCPVVQSPKQRDGGAPGKHTAQVEPDPSSSVPIPTLPPHLSTSVSNLLGPASQDTRSTKLPVSSGPSGSPYINPPPPAG